MEEDSVCGMGERPERKDDLVDIVRLGLILDLVGDGSR